MLSSRASGVFLRTRALTTIDWYELVDSRYHDLRPYLKKMTMAPLGKAMWTGLNPVTLDAQRPTVRGDEGLSLATRCIYTNETHHEGKKNQDGTKLAWALSQDGDWLIVKVSFVVESLDGQKYQLSERGPVYQYTSDHFAERATVVEIRKSDLQQVVKQMGHTVLYAIWYRTGSFVREWKNAREERFREAERLYAQVEEAEALMLRLKDRLPQSG